MAWAEASDCTAPCLFERPVYHGPSASTGQPSAVPPPSGHHTRQPAFRRGSGHRCCAGTASTVQALWCSLMPARRARPRLSEELVAQLYAQCHRVVSRPCCHGP